MQTTIQPPNPPSQHRFHLLDALRGVAAVLVVPRHLPLPLGKVFAPYSSFLAVDFFFCLSGFIVAFSYEQRLATTFHFKDFAITRMVRLYPLALMGIMLGLCIANWNEICAGYHASHLVAGTLITVCSLFLIPVAHYALFPLNGPMWTLFLELIANFTYALLVRCRLAATWIIVAIALSAIAALAIIRVLLGTMDFGWSPATLYVGLARVFVSFFLGVLIFRWHQNGALHRQHARGAVMMAIALSIVLALSLCNPFLLMRSALGEMLAIALIFPAIIRLGARVAVPAAAVRMCAWLGGISYPLYILHKPLIDLLWRVQLIPNTPSSPSIYFYLLLILPPVWLLATFYDVPVRKALTQAFRHRSLLYTGSTLTHPASTTT